MPGNAEADGNADGRDFCVQLRLSRSAGFRFCGRVPHLPKAGNFIACSWRW
jgi:hypothetical protein